MDIDGRAGEIDLEYTPIVDLLPAAGGLELLAERVAVLENEAAHWRSIARLRESERDIAQLSAERERVLYDEQRRINEDNERAWRRRIEDLQNRITRLRQRRSSI